MSKLVIASIGPASSVQDGGRPGSQRYGLVPSDPAYAGIEQRLALQPSITVPSITFDGADDGVRPPADSSQHARHFTGPRTHAVLPGVGHDMPQEVPGVFAEAVLRLVEGASWPGRLA